MKQSTRSYWTESAVNCYNSGCSCKGCFYNDFFARTEYKCQMKKTVRELVKLYGPPPTFAEKLNPFQREVINLFMQTEKLLSSRFIADKLGVTKGKTDGCLGVLLNEGIVLDKPSLSTYGNAIYKLKLDIDGNKVDYGDEILQDVIDIAYKSRSVKKKSKPKEASLLRPIKAKKRVNIKTASKVDDIDKKVTTLKQKEIQPMQEEKQEPRLLKLTAEENQIFELIKASNGLTIAQIREQLPASSKILNPLVGRLSLFKVLQKEDVNGSKVFSLKNDNVQVEIITREPKPPKEKTPRTKKETKSKTLPAEQKPANSEQTPQICEQKPAEIQKPIEDDQELFKQLRQMQDNIPSNLIPITNIEKQEVIRLLTRIVGLLEKLVA